MRGTTLTGVVPDPTACLPTTPWFTHNSPMGALGGFMLAIRSDNFQFSLMLAATLACSLLMWPTAGRAYTNEEQQACSADAFRLCSAEIPDVDRVTVCMIRNKSQLSPGCRVFFRPDPEIAPAAAGRPLSIRPGKHLGTHKPRKPVRKHHAT
jgi:hypothetical protein